MWFGVRGGRWGLVLALFCSTQCSPDVPYARAKTAFNAVRQKTLDYTDPAYDRVLALLHRVGEEDPDFATARALLMAISTERELARRHRVSTSTTSTRS
ncbi:MAG: hypothetical protein ACFB9M_10265 [Myxococcota bacterium]